MLPLMPSVPPQARPSPAAGPSGRAPVVGYNRIRRLAHARMLPLPHLRRRGIGSQLLEAVITHASDRGARLLWCNIRNAAILFYERAGFRVTGALWHDPDTGPHTAMHGLLHSRTGSC